MSSKYETEFQGVNKISVLTKVSRDVEICKGILY